MSVNRVLTSRDKPVVAEAMNATQYAVPGMDISRKADSASPTLTWPADMLCNLRQASAQQSSSARFGDNWISFALKLAAAVNGMRDADAERRRHQHKKITIINSSAPHTGSKQKINNLQQ